MDSLQLTIEQSFKLKVFEEEIKTLNQEQSKELLLEIFKLMMIKDNVVKAMLKTPF